MHARHRRPIQLSSSVSPSRAIRAGSTGGEQPCIDVTFWPSTGLGVAGLMLPSFFGKAIAAEALVSHPGRRLQEGAGRRRAGGRAPPPAPRYCDVRIGRYLRQFVITREDKVQNVVNTESTGVGVRVIANGAWGFAATNDLTRDGVAKAARQAAAIAKANSQDADRAGAAGAGAGRGRSVVEDADQEELRWKCRSRTRSTCCSASTPRR